MKLHTLGITAFTLAATAGSSSAALVEFFINGTPVPPLLGFNSPPVPANSPRTISISSPYTLGTTSISAGSFISTNTSGTGFDLTVNNLVVTTSELTPVQVVLHIVEIYDGSPVPPAAFHLFSGTAAFSGAGQLASFTKVSTHESTALPTLTQTESAAAAGTVALNRNQGPATVVIPFGSTYTIDTTYTFTLRATSAGPVTITLTPGRDVAGTVPTPSTALAVTGTLGALTFTRRRRR